MDQIDKSVARPVSQSRFLEVLRESGEAGRLTHRRNHPGGLLALMTGGLQTADVQRVALQMEDAEKFHRARREAVRSSAPDSLSVVRRAHPVGLLGASKHEETLGGSQEGGSWVRVLCSPPEVKVEQGKGLGIDFL
mmetsp:Transcript_28443/g.55702  ORF Transcript_28443/g.55702 Transcript_28443/m.55702 type:complete len:136 (-) Transcript_28443:937-1344(-)